MKRVEESSLVARNSIFTSNFASTLFVILDFTLQMLITAIIGKPKEEVLLQYQLKSTVMEQFSPIENCAAENALNAMYWSFMEN